MWLIKNGVPEQVAWHLSDGERLARCIAFARFEGQQYDFKTGTFSKVQP